MYKPLHSTGGPAKLLGLRSCSRKQKCQLLGNCCEHEIFLSSHSYLFARFLSACWALWAEIKGTASQMGTWGWAVLTSWVWRGQGKLVQCTSAAWGHPGALWPPAIFVFGKFCVVSYPFPLMGLTHICIEYPVSTIHINNSEASLSS